MYKFVDLNERGTVSTSLSLQTIFNNNKLDEVLTDATGSFTTLSVRGRGNVRQKVNFIDVPHMDGSLESDDPVLDMREIEVRYKIKDSTNRGFRERINRLNSLIQGSKKVLSFTDEDVLFYATLQENNIPEETSNELVCTLIFACSDPYKYGPEKPHQFTDATILTNEGTAEAQPIFELEVLAPVTFAMVSNGNEYNLLGIPADDDIEVIDTKPLVLSEHGETLNTWLTAGTRIDNFIGDIAGTMTYDGTGIMADTFGSGTKMHGPAIIKEIPPIQDFEIETMFDTISNFDEDNYRMEVYMFDEGMNMLGKIGLNDNNRNFTRRIGLARVGEYAGAGVRYAINGSNYKRDDLQRVALMYLRVRREGQKYTFYISEIRNGKHYATITETFNDVNNEYQGKLKYVQLFIGNWQDRRRTFRTRINSVNVYELIKETIDQTPYIANVGDIITFDHVNDELLINGEDRKEIKDFGGSFFSLIKGENQLAVLPSGSFNAKVKHRPRYR